MPPSLPGERGLGNLARRFENAERRVRSLLARAIEGDRRRLLTEALAVLLELRRLDPGIEVERAYAVAATAIADLTGAPVPRGAGARDLGRLLSVRLDRALAHAEQGSRAAFATVTADTLDDVAQDAVTASVTRSGARIGLGSYADRQTRTIGRAATSRGTRDAMSGGWIEISAHGTTSPICMNIEGNTYPADAPSTRYPPYHANCAHFATPVGEGDAYLAAMREAA